MNSDKYKDILATYSLSILSDSDSRAGVFFSRISNLAIPQRKPKPFSRRPV